MSVPFYKEIVLVLGVVLCQLAQNGGQAEDGVVTHLSIGVVG